MSSAITFNSTNAAYNIGNFLTNPGGVGIPITVISWLYPTVLTNNTRILGKGGFPGWFNINIGFFGIGTLDVSIEFSGTDVWTAKEGVFTANQWHYVAMTHAGGLVAADLYTGDLDTLVTKITSYAGANDKQDIPTGTRVSEANANAFIGNQVSLNKAWPGKMGFLGIWNRALTEGEIQQQQFQPHVTANCVGFYEMGTNGLGAQPDWSGNTNNGTVNGTLAQADGLPLPRFGRYGETRNAASIGPQTGVTETGALTIAGGDATAASENITAALDTAALTIVGGDATAVSDYITAALDTGALTIAGGDATAASAITVTTETAAIIVAGLDVSVSAADQVGITETGALTISGGDATAVAGSPTITLETGALIVAGLDVVATYHQTTVALDAAALTIAGGDATAAIDEETVGGIFKFDSANWTGKTPYFEATMTAATGKTVRAVLTNHATKGEIAGSEVTTTATTKTRVRSSALTLVDGTEYIAVTSGSEDGDIYGVRVVPVPT